MNTGGVPVLKRIWFGLLWSLLLFSIYWWLSASEGDEQRDKRKFGSKPFSSGNNNNPSSFQSSTADERRRAIDRAIERVQEQLEQLADQMKDDAQLDQQVVQQRIEHLLSLFAHLNDPPSQVSTPLLPFSSSAQPIDADLDANRPFFVDANRPFSSSVRPIDADRPFSSSSQPIDADLDANRPFFVDANRPFSSSARPIDANRPFFHRQKQVESVQCEQLINGNKLYIKSLTNNRISHSETDQMDINTSCREIRSRHFFPSQPSSKMESKFPIAFARIVYRDYLVQEMILSALYQPQNLYCYVIDKNSPISFKKGMNALANCFPTNVFIMPHQLSISSFGANMTRAHLSCMEYLLNNVSSSFFGDWRYLITLQNDDVPIKTNNEMVQILMALNGSNDVEVSLANADRIPSGFDWHFHTLGLLRNNRNNISEEYEFRFAKGSVQCALCREFVHFLFNRLNLTELLRRIELTSFGSDEIFFSSLDADQRLNAPGGFTRQCLDEHIEIGQITRFSSWGDPRTCSSRNFRHSLCVFGVEDLSQMASRPELFANKMMAKFDFAAISCQLEELYNRSRYSGKKKKPYPVDVYKTRTRVRYHNWVGDRSKLFNCQP